MMPRMNRNSFPFFRHILHRNYSSPPRSQSLKNKRVIYAMISTPSLTSLSPLTPLSPMTSSHFSQSHHLLKIFASLFLLTLVLTTSPVYAQDKASTDLCREAIPSVSLRHLRTGRLSLLDAINEQITIRYSEYLNPSFGGYSINDKLSSIVDQPRPIVWASAAFSSGTRSFGTCDSTTTVFPTLAGIDTFVGSHKNLLIGLNVGYNNNRLNVEKHPIPQTTKFSSTSSDSSTLFGGSYIAWMMPNFHASFSGLLHSNDISITPSDATASTKISGIAGVSTQATVGTHFSFKHINTHISTFLIYENFSVNAFPLSTQDNVLINYDKVDLSNLIPGIRAQANAYYASPTDPYTFYGWKSSFSTKRVYPLGGNTWKFLNNTTGTAGTVHLDTEWTETNIDFTASLRSFNAREFYASIGGVFVWGEHPLQTLKGNDFNIEIGIQLLL